MTVSSILEPIRSYLSNDMQLDESSYLLICLIVEQIKKGKVVKDWLIHTQLEDLKIFYPKEIIDRLAEKLKVIPTSKLYQIKINLSLYFQKDPVKISHKELLNMMPKKIRKKYAIYYTKKEVADLLARLAWSKGISQVLDPSCGKGILLSSMSAIDDKLNLFGCDISFLSNSIAESFSKFKYLGRMDFLKIAKNGTFSGKKIFPGKFDLIIMNPPFTRQSHLTSEYQNFLLKTFHVNERFENGQMGLHSYFILHADNFIQDGGTLAAVLPAAILYSRYGDKIRKLLLDKYTIEYIISSTKQDSFSDDSYFKEILLIARKNKMKKNCKFVTLQTNLVEENKSIILNHIIESKNKSEFVHLNHVDISLLRRSDNWMQFFETDNMLLEKIWKKAHSLVSKTETTLSLRRGVETFGPEFFFLPNKFWKIIEGDRFNVKIYNDIEETEVSIPSKYLIKGLTNTSMYSKDVLPSINEYLVSIPPQSMDSLPEGVRKYIKWGSSLNLAIKRSNFAQKEPWYSFMFKQLQSDSFFGHVFLIRKLRLNTMGVIAHYTNEKYPASKGFYIVHCKPEYAKALVAWLNSSIFLLQLIQYRRKIANHWGELMKEDFLKFYCIDCSKLNEKQLDRLSLALDKFAKINLPGVLKQLDREYRKELDLAVTNVLGISDLYANVIDTLKA